MLSIQQYSLEVDWAPTASSEKLPLIITSADSIVSGELFASRCYLATCGKCIVIVSISIVIFYTSDANKDILSFFLYRSKMTTDFIFM